MNNENIKLSEDAKVDWLSIVKKHRKRQKGLPALSSLNTNAGNVEKNIEMFNMMQPSGSISVDASNGSVSMGEAIENTAKETIPMNDEKIYLEYNDLPIDIYSSGLGGYFDSAFGNYLPNDNSREAFVDWTYTVDKSDVIECLSDNSDVQSELGFDGNNDEEFNQKLEASFNLLFDKYKDYILNHFYDSAVDDAQENYEEDYYYESVDRKTERKDQFNADDSFDMSMRTLL